MSSSGGSGRRRNSAKTSKASASTARKAPSPTNPAAQNSPASAPPRPGLLAPKWEKRLYKAVAAKPPKLDELVAIGRSHPDARHPAMIIDAFVGALTSGDNARARDLLEVLHREKVDPSSIRFLNKYSIHLSARLDITDEVSVSAPVDSDMMGLTLAELRQKDGDLDGAIDLVEGLTPSTVTAVSLAELYAQRERWRDVVEVTNEVNNDDDLTMYLLIQRGSALRELGYCEASREALKKALAKRSRPQDLRHLALIERGQTYLREGKKAMARKDFERVLSENANYPDLAAHLASISG